ncbi:MAG: hypothetical protein ACOYXC_07675 [Candidatus Rifleibacteriota bacterium]
MKIVCEHCKTEIQSCPGCSSSSITQKVTGNLVFLIATIIACLITAYRWYDALDEYERAQRLRRAYLKEKIETRPTLPFAK